VGSAGTKTKMIWMVVLVVLVLAGAIVWDHYRIFAVMLLGIWSLQLLFSLRWAMLRLQKHEPNLT
jgi:tryptophan-rich sensory protein